MELGQEIQSRSHCLSKAADAARHVIAPLFKSKDLSIDYKEAQSPIVTQADRDAERFMREIISEDFPDDTIVGEEFGTKKGSSGYSWVLDPIDGTIAFSVGKPVFGTLIGLAHEADFVLGLIDQPILNERFVGRNGLATLNDLPIKASRNESLEKASLALTAPLEDERFAKGMEPLLEAVHVTSYGGDCYNYALLASGHLDIVIEKGLALHDFAALVPVLEASGAVVTDWMGNGINYHSSGDILACANQAIHRQVMDLLFS